MRRVYLFVVACILPGLGGGVGSVLGHGLGSRGLWVGGVVGGVLASIAVAWLAARVGWIASIQRQATAAGTVVGFLAAAFIASKTLSSPVGPLLSTLLAGLGALIGSSLGPMPARDRDDAGFR